MKHWDQRPIEIRNLFNPAFCGLILFRALHGYEEHDAKGMPFSLSLLLLPLCLYKNSREAIDRNRRSYLLKIIEKHQQIMIGFADQVTQMLPYTFEGLGFLMTQGYIKVTEDGYIQTVPDNKARKAIKGTDETISCQKVAHFIGREFARISDRVTIYTTFGIRP